MTNTQQSFGNTLRFLFLFQTSGKFFARHVLSVRPPSCPAINTTTLWVVLCCVEYVVHLRLFVRFRWPCSIVGFFFTTTSISCHFVHKTRTHYVALSCCAVTLSQIISSHVMVDESFHQSGQTPTIPLPLHLSAAAGKFLG